MTKSPYLLFSSSRIRNTILKTVIRRKIIPILLRMLGSLLRISRYIAQTHKGQQSRPFHTSKWWYVNKGRSFETLKLQDDPLPNYASRLRDRVIKIIYYTVVTLTTWYKLSLYQIHNYTNSECTCRLVHTQHHVNEPQIENKSNRIRGVFGKYYVYIIMGQLKY